MNSIPGYDAWLEEPYQKAYKEEALYEAFVESEAERIFTDISSFVFNKYLTKRIEHDYNAAPEIVKLDSLLEQVADLLANLRSYDGRLVDEWVDRNNGPKDDDHD